VREAAGAARVHNSRLRLGVRTVPRTVRIVLFGRSSSERDLARADRRAAPPPSNHSYVKYA
jgi:hypothetical protein